MWELRIRGAVIAQHFFIIISCCQLLIHLPKFNASSWNFLYWVPTSSWLHLFHFVFVLQVLSRMVRLFPRARLGESMLFCLWQYKFPPKFPWEDVLRPYMEGKPKNSAKEVNQTPEIFFSGHLGNYSQLWTMSKH